MSRSGKIELVWADGKGAGADGKHVFRLPIAQLEELQDICNAGPQRIFTRLSGDDWRTQDVRDTIRLALIGGGMAAEKAATLVSRYCSDGRLLENIIIARDILMAAMHAEEDPAPKKAEGAEETSSMTEMSAASSPSPPSTDSAPH